MTRRTWGMTPPPSAAPETSSTLASKLSAFWVFREGGGKNFPNYPGTPNWGLAQAGTMVWTPTRGGSGIHSDGSTGTLQVADARPFFNQSPTTMWVLIDANMSGSSAQGIIGVRLGFEYRILQLNNNSFEVVNTIGGTTQTLTFSSTATGLHGIALTYDGVNGTSWFDGIRKVTLATGTGLYTSGGGTIPLVFASDTSGNGATMPILAAGLWQRVLTQAELQLLARDPFVLYQPPVWRRYATGAPVLLRRTASPASVALTSAADQLLVPTSDVGAGSWTPVPSIPTTLWDKLDETVPVA